MVPCSCCAQAAASASDQEASDESDDGFEIPSDLDDDQLQALLDKHQAIIDAAEAGTVAMFGAYFVTIPS